ncbi:hypothetical protein F5882DRAFT_5815 [Hyaloscypha sp. PMI_1271]|nr:hypothetical protein F5882DRAFT_5815 [Hyaloscypha sp. PMI_1271]
MKRGCLLVNLPQTKDSTALLVFVLGYYRVIEASPPMRPTPCGTTTLAEPTSGSRSPLSCVPRPNSMVLLLAFFPPFQNARTPER